MKRTDFFKTLIGGAVIAPVITAAKEVESVKGLDVVGHIRLTDTHTEIAIRGEDLFLAMKRHPRHARPL